MGKEQHKPAESKLAKIREFLRANSCRSLDDSLTNEQIVTVLEAKHTYKMHPLAYVLSHACLSQNNNNPRIHILKNIDLGCKEAIKRKEETFLNTKILSACQIAEENYENSSSALAELRAFGALSTLDGIVKPVKTRNNKRQKGIATPDFELTIGESSICVEVKCKQMNQREGERLDKFFSDAHRTQEPEAGAKKTIINGVSIASTTVYPFGTPKNARETVAENVAAKIAGIKPNAKQAARDKPSILWVDFQDEDMKFTAAEDCVPITVWKNSWTSVGLWQAFYGIKGLPIFEEYIPWRSLPPNEQDFPGMFEQTDLWSGAILAFSNELILLENPAAKNPLSMKVKGHLIKMISFNPFLSWIGWGSLSGQENLRRLIINEQNKLRMFGSLARAVWQETETPAMIGE